MILRALIRLLVIACAVLVVASIIPGITISSTYVAFVVAIVWGFVTLLIKPVLSLLTLPINVLTLGLFSFVLNALLFWLVAAVVPGFSVSGFLPALEGSVILSLVHWALHKIF